MSGDSSSKHIYTATIPKNQVAPDIAKLSKEMTEARKLCIEKRQQLDDLDEKREKLQQDLYNAEANLQELHATQVKLMTSQLEGKKRQKLDYDLQLQKKKAAIEEAQRQYEELKLQLASEMTTVQAEIDNLKTLNQSLPRPALRVPPKL